MCFECLLCILVIETVELKLNLAGFAIMRLCYANAI